MSLERRHPDRFVGIRISQKTPWQRLVLGLVILTAGVLFWLDNIGRIDAGDYLMWWPVALVAMGIAHLLEGRWFGALIWLAIGAYFLLPLLGIPRVHLRYVIGVWPLLISVAGGVLVMQALRRGRGSSGFNAVAVMGGNNHKISSQSFTGGEAIAVMGGCEIDLTRAKIAGDEAVIDVLAFWGGVELRVPRSWQVVSRVLPILGGLQQKPTGVTTTAGGPRLVVRGAAIMGGVEVRSIEEPAV
jgi:hypothetical protein